MWRFLRSVPKWALALGIVVGFTAILIVYLMQRSARDAFYKGRPTQIADTSAKEALVASKQGRLLMVDDDLYDLDTGKVIFSSWLKEGIPLRLFYDLSAKKFIARYEHGFVRYGLNGASEATMARKVKCAYSNDLKFALFGQDKDIWRADMDWKEFKFVNEKRVTSIEQFNDQYFAESIVLHSDKALLVHTMNKVLRVDLESGDVKPVQISLLEIGKRRSPDGKSAVGLEGGKFYSYDVETNSAKGMAVGRGVINDYQWLGDERCASIFAMKSVLLYDREKHDLSEIAALPVPCNRMGEASPDGRFVFCVSGVTHKGALVDTVKKSATQVAAGAGVGWVSNDTFAYSRDVPDSDVRGAWLQTVGEGERRVSPDPYVVNAKGSSLILLKPFGLVIFATKHGVAKMKSDGTGFEEFIKTPRPPQRLVNVDIWAL